MTLRMMPNGYYIDPTSVAAVYNHNSGRCHYVSVRFKNSDVSISHYCGYDKTDDQMIEIIGDWVKALGHGQERF